MESLGEGFGGQAVLPGPAVGVSNSHPSVSARSGRRGWLVTGSRLPADTQICGCSSRLYKMAQESQFSLPTDVEPRMTLYLLPQVAEKDTREP